MYKKQLYRTALISSPIMAVFELSPLFFLTNHPPFWGGFIFVSGLVFIIWLLNIFVISIEASKTSRKTWERYILSYSFTLLLFALIWISSEARPHPNQPEKPSAFFPLINILTSNTIVLIISNAIISYSKKVQADNELAELKIKHLEAEQQQLIQQLQPHFLFNSLSTLKSLIKTDAELAAEYLVKLSDFLRFTISAHENSIISLADELQFASDYIELQQIRFAGTFTCKISIPETCKHEYYLPVYALQTLVENAIKHNAFTEEYPLNLSIAFENGLLMVSNNKIPKPNANEKGGIGLKNLKKRYSLMMGEPVMIDESPDNFKVSIKLLKQMA